MNSSLNYINIKFLLFIFILSSSQVLNAQVHLNLGGGFSLPLKPAVFIEEWKTGLNFGFGIGFNLSEKSLIEIRLNYIKYDYNSEVSPYGYEIKGAEILKLIPSLNYKLYPFTFDAVINQFFQIGTGYVLTTQNDAELTSFNTKYIVVGQNKTAMLLNFGLGIDVYLFKGCKLFLIGTYEFAYTNLSDMKSIQFLSAQSGINIFF